MYGNYWNQRLFNMPVVIVLLIIAFESQLIDNSVAAAGPDAKSTVDQDAEDIFEMVDETFLPDINPNAFNDTWQARKALRAKLKNGYSRLVSPLSKQANGNNALVVQFRMIISRFEVDDKLQSVSLEGLIEARWNDTRLKWQPSDFNNINTMLMEQTSVWLPDFAVYNSKSMQKNQMFTNALALVKVYANGTVFYDPPFSLSFMCPFNFKNYPNDKQICTLFIGPWSICNDELVMELWKIPDSYPVGLALESTRNQGQWTLNTESVSASVTVDSIHHCDFSHLGIDLEVQRNLGSFFAGFITIPMFATSGITLLSFGMRSHYVRFIVLAVATVGEIAHGYYLRSTIPTGAFSSNPGFAQFFKVNLLLTLSSLCLTVISFHIAHCTASMPGLVKNGILQCRLVKSICLFGLQRDSQNSELLTVAPAEDTYSVTTIVANKPTDAYHWTVLAGLLDRAICITFVVLYALVGVAVCL